MRRVYEISAHHQLLRVQSQKERKRYGREQKEKCQPQVTEIKRWKNADTGTKIIHEKWRQETSREQFLPQVIRDQRHISSPMIEHLTIKGKLYGFCIREKMSLFRTLLFK